MKQTFSSSFSRAAFLLLLMLFTAQAVWADDIVITSANFTDYFDYNSDFQFRDANNSTTLTNGGYFLKATVAAESTLDFQGEFVPDGTHKPRIFINKRVNITSSDKSAIFKNGATSSYWMFCMLEGADYTEVKNLKFINACLYVNDASYVTIDGIEMEANVSNLGISTGFLSVYSTKTTTPSDHVTIKNSHIVNGGTGSATVVIGNGGLYAVVDNNVVEYNGNGANMLYATTFQGTGDAPKYVKFTNNELNNPNDATGSCWAIVVCAAGSLVEGNTVNYKGNGITTQFGSSVGEDDDKVVYRNNTINNGGSMSVLNYSVVENNYVSGTLTISQGATATCNTASKLVVSGSDAIVQYNIAYGDVDINSSAIKFTGNTVNGTVSLKGSTSNNNTITGNAIISSASYAISRTKTLTGNKIEGNMLISSDKQGDEAVDPAIGSDNTIQNNTGGTVITSETSSMTAGNNGTFYYVPANTSVTIPGSVSVTGSAGQSVNIILFAGATLTINGISYGTGYNAILIAHEGATGEYWTTYYNGVKSFVADANTTVYQASVNSSKTGVVLTEVTGREIPAGKGVVLKSTSTTIMLTPAATTQTLDGNELQGSDVDLATPTNAYCLSKETTRDGGLTPRGVGFYTYTLATIPAHRAYLVVEGGPNPARGFLGFGDDDNTTGISLPEAVIVETDGPIYDLSGRRVTGQPHKGIYVKDGKKFVIK